MRFTAQRRSGSRQAGASQGVLPPRFLLAAALLLGSSSPALAEAQATAEAARPNPWTMCAKATNRVERLEGMPRQLLRAISKIESGRFHRGKQLVMAWPWTVMAEGRGRYLRTKADAIAEVEALWARGISNIDVGCMQVNLHHHPGAFASLDEAFDPLTNVTYAASFLKSLALEQGSWAKAVARYHSANPERYRLYRAKVHTAWRKEREKYLVALTAAREKRQQALASAAGAATNAATGEPGGESTPLLLATLAFATASLPGMSTATPAEQMTGPESTAEAPGDPFPGPLAFGRAGPIPGEPEPNLLAGR